MEKRLIFAATLFTSYLTLCRTERKYDYIVVGAGSAGSVVANRLSANQDNTVLLLEAGERPNLLSEIPNFYFYMQKTKYDWNNTVQMPSFPEYNIKSKNLPFPQGKILGGTSTINGMVYTRGNKQDYQNWVRNGAVGWDWENVLRLFKKSENNQDIIDGFHGTHGEMFVQRPSFRTPMAARYLDAAKELGYTIGDVNGKKQSVFMSPQLTVHNGRRWGSYKAFTHSVEGRPNFLVKTSAFVRRVIFNGNHSGVEYDYKGERNKVYANKEVILSAGAVKSPQILMLSGIGPKEELRKLGIPVISDLPVGKNFHDHAVINVYSKVISKSNISGLSMSEKDYNEFLLSGKGILSDISSEAIGFVSSRGGGGKKALQPNIEIIFSTFVQPRSFAPHGEPIPTSSCIAVLLKPKSHGEVTLKSTDPYDQPNIDPKYLSNEDDVKVIVEGIKKCQAFENTKAMKNILETKETEQNSDCQNYTSDSYEYFACLAKSLLLPGYHISGSCKMGDPKDPTSVVDPNLRVIGVEGLRVVDNSIMPSPVSGHTHAIAVMIGEKGAESILKESLPTKSYQTQ